MNLLQLWKLYRLTKEVHMKAVLNWHTTLLGFAAGAFYYIQNCGCTIPTTWAEAKVFGVSLAIAALGAAAKDGRTGSAPGATN